MLTDETNANEKYLSAIKEKVPSVFYEYFGLKKPALNPNDFLEKRLFDKYYTDSIDVIRTSTVIPILPEGFRSLIKNRTQSLTEQGVDKVAKNLSNFWQESVSVMENLPLYVALSYLLTQYGLLFISSLIDLKNKKNEKLQNLKISEIDAKSLEILEKNINDSNKNLKVQGKKLATLKRNNLKQSFFLSINHNFEYIRDFFKENRLLEHDEFSVNRLVKSNRSEKLSFLQRPKLILKEKTSYFFDLIEKMCTKK